jgi:hypothetical protein
MRRYEGYQVDRITESWFRSNIGIIIHSLALALAVLFAHLHLGALNEGLVKNYFYIIYFFGITYNMIAIGILASGRKDLAANIGAYT